jgi:hypothetical protein
MQRNRRTKVPITRRENRHRKNHRLSGAAKRAAVSRDAATASAKIGANENHKIIANGFALQPIDRIPFNARPRKETRISWLNTECGEWAELCGATRLFQTDSKAVIAEVKDDAYLIPFGEADRVQLSEGIWSVCPSE